jgi:hypothetical protein
MSNRWQSVLLQAHGRDRPLLVYSIQESGGFMFAIRLSISALTLIFLLLAMMTRDIGLLDAIVVTCPLLYLILDMREELQTLKLLEDRISSFSAN